ncbi:riboflavin synthase [Bartonella sp. DGB1]|uniref:riboflavin synthase n=1 Tax=Bartonella sp. DGB1 TaxID=3239807 RepID=UPI003524FAD9
MFTGIVTDKGKLLQKIKLNSGLLLRILTNYKVAEIKIGASIACNGICLTVVNKSELENWFEVEVWQETLVCTNVIDWQIGYSINLERALKIGDELGGHIVSGHIDTCAKIVQLHNEGDALRLHIELPEAWMSMIISKGSITINGVSLTINSVSGNIIDVLLIQHTQQITNLGECKLGDIVNIEIDQLTKITNNLLLNHFKRLN